MFELGLVFQILEFLLCSSIPVSMLIYFLNIFLFVLVMSVIYNYKKNWHSFIKNKIKYDIHGLFIFLSYDEKCFLCSYYQAGRLPT